MDAWIVGALALLGVGAAVAAFLRTPPSERYRLLPPVPEDGVEYAEEYSRSERIKFAVLVLGVMLPLMAATQFWLFPALRAFSETSHCYAVYGVSGTALLMYGLFVGLPLGNALIVGVPGAYIGFRILKDRQSPPQDKKVFRRTKIRRGRWALAIGYAHLLPLLFFIGLAVWGRVQAEELLAGYDPAGADFSSCAPSHGQEPTGESAAALRAIEQRDVFEDVLLGLAPGRVDPALDPLALSQLKSSPRRRCGQSSRSRRGASSSFTSRCRYGVVLGLVA